MFGRNCSFNVNTLINAGSSIIFGDDFLGGWNVSIIDGDGHTLIDHTTKKIVNGYKPIIIGNHCWASAHVTILKGVSMGNDVIIPYGCTITNSCMDSFVIFGGSPNRILKHNIERR